MSPYFSISNLCPSPLFGRSFEELPQATVVQRFAERSAQPGFFLTALGDVEPVDLQAEWDRGSLRAFAASGSDGKTADPVLFLSTMVGLPMAYRWSAGGSDFQVFAEDLTVLADALFRADPKPRWLMTALPAPPPPDAEDALLGAGFERINSSSDVLGTQTWGIRRMVCESIVASLG